MKPLIIQVTVGAAEGGEKLAQLLVESGLAACVQRISNIQSTYQWQGKICHDTETLLLIKSSQEKWEEIQKVILENHPYECPEIVAISPLEIEKKYLSWWLDSINRPKTETKDISSMKIVSTPFQSH